MEIERRQDMKRAAIAGALITGSFTGLMFVDKLGIFLALLFPGYMTALLVGGGLDYIHPFALWVVFPVANWVFYSVIAYLSIVMVRVARNRKASEVGS